MAASAGISLYSRAWEIESDKTIPLDIFLENIKSGKWQDLVLPIRALKTKSERDEAKKKVPGVTLAGKFRKRADAELEQHSGYLGMDFDDLKEPETFKEAIGKDIHCLAAFRSISGRGVCAIFKVDPRKHKEAFQGLSKYLFEKYKELCDPTSINPSRLRFVSFDPNIIINYGSVQKFTQYIKDKPPKKVDKAIYAPDDFGFVMEQVLSKRLNLVENYYEWLRIGFALVHQFGENGRSYFHQLSQFSSKYDPDVCDKQYNNCLKHKGSNVATIAMFYYYARNAGVSIYSERTKKIAYAAAQGKKSGLDANQIANNLEKFENITGAEDIIKQVIENNIELNEDTLLDQLEIYLRQNYELRRNSITRYIENAGTIVYEKELNSIFIKAKKIFDNLSFDLFSRLINSEFIPDYNPILEFIELNKHRRTEGNIDKLFGCIKNQDPKYCQYFGKKWFVSMIAMIFGEQSPLQLVLCGKGAAGKTQFFRRLLPDELKKYYGESKLDKEKDDEILMTQKILLVNDEYGGKTRKDERKMKDLSDKEIFSLREPYGRSNVDLRRLALLGGTTNERDILSDWTGNRRIIPVIVEDVNKELYNSIDKTDLFIEAYWLWKEGFDWHILGDDIKYLRQDEEMFEVIESEKELIQKYYKIPEGDEDVFELTASEIKVEMEKLTNQRLILNRIGSALLKLGFEQIHRKSGTGTKRVYLVAKTARNTWQQDNQRPEGSPF